MEDDADFLTECEPNESPVKPRLMREAPRNPSGLFYGPWILAFNSYDGGWYQVRYQFRQNGEPMWKGIGADDFGVKYSGRRSGSLKYWIPLPRCSKKG